jgi:hypothetical protein
VSHAARSVDARDADVRDARRSEVDDEKVAVDAVPLHGLGASATRDVRRNAAVLVFDERVNVDLNDDALATGATDACRSDVNDIDVRDLEGRTLRFVVSSALGFSGAWVLSDYLPTRPGVSGGGMDPTLILAGCIGLSILMYGVFTVAGRWQRDRRREQIPRAVVRVSSRGSLEQLF